MKVSRSQRISGGLVLVGCAMIVAAKAWIIYGERLGSVIGANIGAGLLGLLGISLASVALIVFVISLIRRSR